MAQRKSNKIKMPSLYEAKVLREIAQSRLIKTHLSTKDVPVWTIDGGREISHECAQALIRNSWLKPERDGLPMFDETQTYTVLKPIA